jgi:uncharacterized protein
MAHPFLTARWESLLFLNYACPPHLLEPLVPAGTTLDCWEDTALISLVGFLFKDTRIRGIGIPGHRTFEEVNLRFYVRRKTSEGDTRRAVVFIRELVPRRAIATVARLVYNEPYRAVRMAHAIDLDPMTGGLAQYAWWHQDQRFTMRGIADGPAHAWDEDSEAAFITEHYWGYTRQRDGGTLEYRVDHPPWTGWPLSTASFTGNTASLYGQAFADVLRGPPRSAYLALGSPVSVYPGRRLDTT